MDLAVGVDDYSFSEHSSDGLPSDYESDEEGLGGHPHTFKKYEL